MLKRLLVAVPLAVMVTGGLFWVMREVSNPAPDIPLPPDIVLTKEKGGGAAPAPSGQEIVPLPEPPPPDPKDYFDYSIDKDFRLRPLTDPKDHFDGSIADDFPFPLHPSPIIRSRPEYPACGTGTGEVVLDFVVEPDGHLSDIKVVSATSECFAKAAISAARNWRYRPEVVEGKPVRSGRKRVTIIFELE